MKIIKGTEAIPVAHPVFLIFGQPGIMKTSLGYSMKDPLLLDFDNGAHRAANRRDTLQIGKWADVVELTPEILEPYQSITVDTVGRCLDMITADIAVTDPKKAPGGNLSQQGWGVLKNRFKSWTSQMRVFGKDVLLIAHDKEEKDGDTRIVRPDIVGGSYGEVMKVADFVGYAYMSGKDRILDFNPTDRWVGKNPARWEPFKVPPVAKAGGFMAELVDMGRAALGSISEESAKIAAHVSEWRGKIDTYTTVAEINRAVEDSQKLPAIMAPQVKTLILAKATELKFTFDKAAKKFVAPETVAA
jgi:hypothetical protein